jgi:limonene-1,2-epoxide hydrolase
MAFTVLTEAFHEATALLLQQKETVAVKMYIEYAASPSAPTQATVQGTGDHNAYYTGLTGADFLRVDVAKFSRVVASGHYQGLSTLDYTNNKITFTGFTSDGGSTGEKGTTISSKDIYGAAVVVSDTSVNTVANDIIIARSYFDTADHITVSTSKGASVQVILNLVNDGACTAFATGDVTFTAVPTSGNTVTIIDNAATPVTKVFEFNSTVTTADGSTINEATGSGSTTNICVGTSGVTGTGTSARLTSAINGTSGFEVTAVDSATVAGKVELTQNYCNSIGDTTITDDDSDANLTVTSFTGGA